MVVQLDRESGFFVEPCSNISICDGKIRLDLDQNPAPICRSKLMLVPVGRSGVAVLQPRMMHTRNALAGTHRAGSVSRGLGGWYGCCLSTLGTLIEAPGLGLQALLLGRYLLSRSERMIGLTCSFSRILHRALFEYHDTRRHHPLRLQRKSRRHPRSFSLTGTIRS